MYYLMLLIITRRITIINDILFQLKEVFNVETGVRDLECQMPLFPTWVKKMHSTRSIVHNLIGCNSSQTLPKRTTWVIKKDAQYTKGTDRLQLESEYSVGYNGISTRVTTPRSSPVSALVTAVSTAIFAGPKPNDPTTDVATTAAARAVAVASATTANTTFRSTGYSSTAITSMYLLELSMNFSAYARVLHSVHVY